MTESTIRNAHEDQRQARNRPTASRKTLRQVTGTRAPPRRTGVRGDAVLSRRAGAGEPAGCYGIARGLARNRKNP